MAQVLRPPGTSAFPGAFFLETGPYCITARHKRITADRYTILMRKLFSCAVRPDYLHREENDIFKQWLTPLQIIPIQAKYLDPILQDQKFSYAGSSEALLSGELHRP